MSVPEDEIRAATLHLVSAYQTLIGQQNWDAWIELWAEDCELTFPFAPAGRTRIYRGKAEIKAYMSATPGRVAIDGIDHARVFSMQDPTIAVAEISVRGHIPETGAPYNQSYVLFFETKDGKLWRYREYWNPIVFIDALRGHEAGNAGGAA